MSVGVTGLSGLKQPTVKQPKPISAAPGIFENQAITKRAYRLDTQAHNDDRRTPAFEGYPDQPKSRGAGAAEDVGFCMFPARAAACEKMSPCCDRTSFRCG
ncbi:MAG: hypothetical protein K0V04_11040, partial [Deltaproteobacteria bacterium]|nr:hypothetical protein [Deltaproteobacteria bacterium]